MERVKNQKKIKPWSNEWVVSLSLAAATKDLGGDIAGFGINVEEVDIFLRTDPGSGNAKKMIKAQLDFIARTGTNISDAPIRVAAETFNTSAPPDFIDPEQIIIKASKKREKILKGGE